MAALAKQQSIGPIDSEQVPTPSTLAAKVSKSDLGHMPPTLVKLELEQPSPRPSPLSSLTPLGSSNCDVFSPLSPVSAPDSVTSLVLGGSTLTWTASERDEEQQVSSLLFPTKVGAGGAPLTRSLTRNHDERNTQTLASQPATFPVQLFPSLAAAKAASSSLHSPLPISEPPNENSLNAATEKMSFLKWVYDPPPHIPPPGQNRTKSRSRAKRSPHEIYTHTSSNHPPQHSHFHPPVAPAATPSASSFPANGPHPPFGSAILPTVLDDFERLVGLDPSSISLPSRIDHPSNPPSSSNQPLAPPSLQRLISSNADFLANMINNERAEFSQTLNGLKLHIKNVEARKEAADRELETRRQHLQALEDARRTERAQFEEHWSAERRKVEELETMVTKFLEGKEVERLLQATHKEHEAEVTMLKVRAEKERQDAAAKFRDLSSRLHAAVEGAGLAHAQAMRDMREQRNEEMRHTAANYQGELDHVLLAKQRLQQEKDGLEQELYKAREANARMQTQIAVLEPLVARLNGEVAEKTNLETRAQKVQEELDATRRDLESSFCACRLKDERLREAEEGNARLTAEVGRLKMEVADPTEMVEREGSLRTQLDDRNHLLSEKLEKRDVLLAGLRSSLATIGLALACVSDMEMKNRSFSPNDDRPNLDEHSGTVLALHCVLQESTNDNVDGSSPTSVPIFSMDELEEALRSRPTAVEKSSEVPQGRSTPARSTTPSLPAPPVQPSLSPVTTPLPRRKLKIADAKAKDARVEVVITVPSTSSAPTDLARYKSPSMTSLRYTPSPQPPRSSSAQNPQDAQSTARYSEAAPSVGPSSGSSTSSGTVPPATVSMPAAVVPKPAVQKPIAAQPRALKRTRKPTAKSGRKPTSVTDCVRAQNTAHAQAKMKRFWYTLEEEGKKVESDDMAEVDDALTLTHTPTKEAKGKQRSVQGDDQSKPETASTIIEANVSETLKELDFSFVDKPKRGRPPKKRKLALGHPANLAATTTTLVGPTKGDDSTLNMSIPTAIQTQPAESGPTTSPSSAASSSTLKRKRSDETSATSTAPNMLQGVIRRMQSSDTPRPPFPNAFPSFSGPALSGPPPTGSADVVKPKPISFLRKPDGKGIKLPGRLDDS